MSNSTYTSLGHPGDQHDVTLYRRDGVLVTQRWLVVNSQRYPIRDLRNLRTAQGDRRQISNGTVIAAGTLLVVIIAAAQCLSRAGIDGRGRRTSGPDGRCRNSGSELAAGLRVVGRLPRHDRPAALVGRSGALQPDLPSSDPRAGASGLIQLGGGSPDEIRGFVRRERHGLQAVKGSPVDLEVFGRARGSRR